MPVDIQVNIPPLKLWFLLHQTYNMVLKCEDSVIKAYDITTEQYAVLLAIRNIKNPVIPSQVALWLDRNKNSVSLIVDRMVKAGLVRKIRDLPDRRSHRLVITRHGKKIMEQASIAGWELVREILSPLTDEEMNGLSATLESIRNRAYANIQPGEVIEVFKIDGTQTLNQFLKSVNSSGPRSSLSND